MVLAAGPAGAGGPVDRTCSASRVRDSQGQIACIDVLKGYQAAKGWTCDLFDWSDYLRTQIPAALWQEMGGLVPVLEFTADAFCDKGHPEN
jgi:hypothetical protein